VPAREIDGIVEPVAPVSPPAVLRNTTSGARPCIRGIIALADPACDNRVSRAPGPKETAARPATR
jgi:hypothetical protein